MTAATEIQPYRPSFGQQPARAAAAASQATAIEQQRAIAEVQASVVVAQSCPRDMAAAEAEMEYVCGRLDMAEQAFYQVDNRGTGPSVHLMRELARIWGNVDYGVKELHRDDEKGASEVQAFSWDIQKNTRSSRTFINPHARMKGRGAARERVQLVDLTDIYLSNQNIGARAVRECISTILPRWFTEKAQEICRRTLEHGEGEPLQDRINTMVDWFGRLGVSVAQLEARAGKARGAWDARDVAQFKIAGKSIAAGEAQKDDLFPPIEGGSSSVADEIAAAPKTAQKEGSVDDPAKRPARTRKPRGAAKDDTESAAKTDAAPESTQETPQQETRVGDGNETNKVDTEDEPEGTTAAADPGPTGTDLRKSLRQQLDGAIFSIFGDYNLGSKENREDRLVVIRAIVGRRDIDSSNNLSDDERQRLRNGLVSRNQSGTLEADITEWLNEETLRQEGIAAQADAESGQS